MTFITIVAASENNVIGINNKLPWDLPEDLAYFRKVTMGHIVCMGRKTFESIGKPLPGRKNIVITSDHSLRSKGVITVTGLEDLITYLTFEDQNQIVFFIGGQQVYNEFTKGCNKIYITRIHKEFVGDAYFPEIDKNRWEIESEIKGESIELPHTYQIWNNKLIN